MILNRVSVWFYLILLFNPHQIPKLEVCSYHQEENKEKGKVLLKFVFIVLELT